MFNLPIKSFCKDVLSGVNIKLTGGGGPKGATMRIIIGINYDSCYAQNCLYLGQIKDEFTNSTASSHIYFVGPSTQGYSSTNCFYMYGPELTTTYNSINNNGFATQKTEQQIKTEDMVTTLNNGRSGNNTVWILDTAGKYIQGFPVPRYVRFKASNGEGFAPFPFS